MSEKKRPALTRSQNRQYQGILRRCASYADVEAYHLSWMAYKGGEHAKRSLAWAAYYFAKRWNGRDINMKKLQKIVLDWGDSKCLYEYARDVPGANIRRFAHAMVHANDPDMMRLFVANVPGVIASDTRYLIGMAAVAEVMSE